MSITKAERTELRSVVRHQFKVLRAEVQQRRAELYAQIEQEVAERFRAEDQQRESLQHAVREAVLACNRQINDLLYEHEIQARSGAERMWVREPLVSLPPSSQRTHLRQAAVAKLDAQVKGAYLSLERQEADLLRDLATSAIESAEARQFLAQIPSVGELVPATRLTELDPGPPGHP